MENIIDERELIAEVIKHLAGKHDQKKHSGGESFGSAVVRTAQYALEVMKMGVGVASYGAWTYALAKFITPAIAVATGLPMAPLAAALGTVSGLAITLPDVITTLYAHNKVVADSNDKVSPSFYMESNVSEKIGNITITGKNDKDIRFVKKGLETLPDDVQDWVRSKRIRIQSYPLGCKGLWGFVSAKNSGTFIMNSQADKVMMVNSPLSIIDLTPKNVLVGAVSAHELLHKYTFDAESKYGSSWKDIQQIGVVSQNPKLKAFYNDMDFSQKLTLTTQYPSIAPRFYESSLRKVFTGKESYSNWAKKNVTKASYWDDVASEGAAFMLSDYCVMPKALFNLKYSKKARRAWATFTGSLGFTPDEKVTKSLAESTNMPFSVIVAEDGCRYYMDYGVIRAVAEKGV